MDAARLDPFRELEDMADRLNRLLFSRPARRQETGREVLSVADWMPAVDICETDKEYLIKAELPEVKKEDVKVTVQDGVLTFQGERRQEAEETGRKYHRVERAYGTFARSFTVPDDVNEAKVRAEFKDGLLCLYVPKSEKAQPKQIEIKIA